MASNEEMRTFIVENLGVNRATAAGLRGADLNRAYKLAQEQGEKDAPIAPKPKKKKKQNQKQKQGLFGRLLPFIQQNEPPVPEANKGGVIKKKKLAKGGFPDLSGDGKVTQKDVLMGRGAMHKGGMYAAGGYVTDMMGKKKK